MWVQGGSFFSHPNSEKKKKKIPYLLVIPNLLLPFAFSEWNGFSKSKVKRKEKGVFAKSIT
jgi:hypothetical protein